MTRSVVRDKRGVVHRFNFSDYVGTCSCNRWAVTKIPMTAKRAEQLARKYGKVRFGPTGALPFVELTKEQALRDWGYHIANLPEQGELRRGVETVLEQGREEVVAV